jgi:hypothetical protein
MTEELLARIKQECNFGDIQKIINTIEGEPAIFSFWLWSDIKTIIKERFPEVNITSEVRDSVMRQLDKMEYYPASGEDMVDALDTVDFSLR